MKANSMSNFMTVLGFLNGMIGSTVLILPMLGIKSGYLGSTIVCILLGLAQFYSCYLLVLHIGKSNSLKDSVLEHFGNDYRYVKFYSFTFWLAFVLIFFTYFRLIVLQLVGLFG
jgi:amino acid permease